MAGTTAAARPASAARCPVPVPPGCWSPPWSASACSPPPPPRTEGWHDGCREARERGSLPGAGATWLLVAALVGVGMLTTDRPRTAGDGIQIAALEPVVPAPGATQPGTVARHGPLAGACR